MNLHRARINDSVSGDSVTSMWIARIDSKRKDTIAFNCTSALLHIQWAKGIYANVRKQGFIWNKLVAR